MKKILLAGSSIFQQWGSAEDLAPGYLIKNRAVGGTITDYWRQNLPAVLKEELPDALLFYCGSNDLCQDVPEAEILANIEEIRQLVDDFSPAIKFAYFSIIKAPQKNGKWELIDRLNADIEAVLPEGDLYVDTNELFFVDQGPVDCMFGDDDLHMTNHAYSELALFAGPSVRNWLSGK